MHKYTYLTLKRDVKLYLISIRVALTNAILLRFQQKIALYLKSQVNVYIKYNPKCTIAKGTR